MSDISLPSLAAATAPPDPLMAESAPKPWLAQVWLDTLSRTGARLGLAWVLLVAICGVFAPLLANSYPVLVKMNDRWSSPLLAHLTVADVTLLVVFLAAMVLYFISRLGFVAKLLIFLALTILTLAAAMVWIRPPQTNIYEEYREAEAAGRVQWILRAPVPYSVGDHLLDQFDLQRPHPWAPSGQHWLGTDIYGADILSHMIHACRIALAIGFISTGIAMIIGVVIGGLMGYFVGMVDLLGMRLVEVFGAIPTIYLLLTFVAAFPEYRSIYLIMAIIGLTGWTGDARFVRAEFLKLRTQDFVQAAVAAGLPLRSILFRHLLPNAVAPLLVSASFGIAGAILSESTLSFLGLGIPVGDASWGQLLNEAVSAGGGFHWWLATFPGLAIFLTVLSYNLIGEAFRDALDPRLRGTK